jgi:hypothetical protein
MSYIPGLQDVDHKNSVYGNCLADFKMVEELGRGSYGVVYKVQSSKDA